MFHHVAYYLVSTGDPSLEAQRAELGGTFDQEFSDEEIVREVPVADRPGFAALLNSVRRGDTVHVSAVNRLGRDATDVQSTLRRLVDAGLKVDVHGLGLIAPEVGELILAVMVQVADMERRRIVERAEAGRQVARAAIEATGRTHRGKESLGRRFAADATAVRDWRQANSASIAETARKFRLSPATVKRYCAADR